MAPARPPGEDRLTDPRGSSTIPLVPVGLDTWSPLMVDLRSERAWLALVDLCALVPVRIENATAAGAC